jgi:hypothetical protein
VRLDCHPKDKNPKKTEQRPREILEGVAERWVVLEVICRVRNNLAIYVFFVMVQKIKISS